MSPALAAIYTDPHMSSGAPVHEIDPMLTEDEFAQFGPCAKKYSYPEFFLEEWVRVQREMETQIGEERAARKRDREERKQQRLLQKKEGKSVKKKNINWRDRCVSCFINMHCSNTIYSNTAAQICTLLFIITIENICIVIYIF